jgi:hypothetical protein
LAAPAAQPTAALFDPAASSPVLLEQLKALYASLDYDKVIPVAEAVLAREDLGVEQRLEAYRLYGSAKAIVEDPVDAEKPFRMLLRSRPDYDLPKGTPPKILAVFRKVQSEEKALSAQLREVERARIVSGLQLLGDLPTEGKGGVPLSLNFRLRDLTGAVEAIRVPYRRAGEASFSSLALQRSQEGEWRGQIPGEFTASERGFQLEYFVETLSPDGPLLTVGTLREPKRIDISAGQVIRSTRPPVPQPVFFAAVAVTAVAAAGAGGLALALNDTQKDYQLKSRGSEPVSGSLLVLRANQGQQLATATNATLIGAAVALVVTVVLAPFVNWANEQ